MADRRNQPCPCGSGKRYKKCCGLMEQGPVVPWNLETQHNRNEAQSAVDFFNKGEAAAAQNRLDEAARYFRQALTLQPDYPDALNNLGVICLTLGQLEEAVSAFRQALKFKPDYVEAHCNLGVIFNELGKRDDAIASFRKALSLRHDYARAYKGLSLLVKYADADEELNAMEDLFNKRDTSEEDRKDLGFALGNYFEDLREYDKSFIYFLEANRLKRKSYQYAILYDRDLFARIRKTFSHDFLSSHHGSGNQDRTPIFIVGLPRSGTTLIEQILASHPQVFGAGELPVLVNLTNDVCTLKSAAKFPECILDLGMDVLKRMGTDYIEKIREYSNDAQYITDKMPHNFLRVGLIKTVLPNAKIIHCMRNPMDNCLSIFKMDFTSPRGYAYDMIELGQYYNLYKDLMAHWEKVLPGFIYTLRYEEMVSDQQHQTRNLLDFCGLPWNENCLTFYKTERRVSTASFVQVRQPIYRDSIELWRQYEKQLEPLRKAIYR